MEKHFIWMDCDVGVDDAVALLTARQLPELEVLGVGAVAGNVGHRYTFPNARKILHLAGVNWPVYPGAERPLVREPIDAGDVHGPDGLWGAELALPEDAPETLPAWDALYAAAKAHPGALELIATGPLTNVAIALEKHPELKTLLPRILIMGGAAVGGNCAPVSPKAEFNIFADPDAAEAVFASGVPIVMCGLDVTERAYLTPGELEKIYALGGPVARAMEAFTRPALRESIAFGFEGLQIHDLCPVLYAIHPDWFTAQTAAVHVETRPLENWGQTLTDLFTPEKQADRHVTVVLDLDREAFTGMIFRAMEKYARA